jgi:excisionase family DNA binding protein
MSDGEILTPREYWWMEAKPAEKVPYLSARELAALLHVSEAQVRRWARRGRIKSYKIGNLVRFLWWDIEPAIPRLWHLLGRPQSIHPSTQPDERD